nr:MFS transporter [Paracoccus limosus]
MSLLDTNVMALASPVIAEALRTGPTGTRWLISAFFLGFATSLLPAGAISDLCGRRRVLIRGLAALALTSLMAGAAPGLGWLVWARAAQGVAMGFVLASALALIGQRFPEPQARARAWMLWGTIMGLTMVVAPVLGGLILHFSGWRGVFLLNVPICLGLGLAIRSLATESADLDREAPDAVAILSFAVAMFCGTWMLIAASSAGWADVQVLAAGALGALALAGLVLRLRGRRAGVGVTPLYRQRRVVGAVMAMFAYAATAQVMASLLPIGMRVLAGATPLQIGVLMLPFTSAMLIFPRVGAQISQRIGVWWMLLAGLATIALGTAAAAALAGGPLFFAALFVIGAGAGAMNGETQKAIMMTMPPGSTGLASGISTTARFSGVLLGFTALSGMIEPSAAGLSGIAPAMAGAMAAALAAAGVIWMTVRPGARG